MRFFLNFGLALKAVCRFIGLGAADNVTGAETVHGARPTIAVPAVASFVMRAHVDRFFLASRLASVNRLNTPHGRVPRGQLRRSAGLPPVPAERIGAKKTRLDTNRGARVPRPATATPKAKSNVIVFPVRSATQRIERLATAA